jgi:prepilin-type N-terminal cleavage/methylation domain-containing protein
MKRLPWKNELGFTLIEIIAVLVILGIMAVGLSNFVIYGVQSFIFARDADQLSQRAQLALARIKQELVDITPDPNNPAVNPISLASQNEIDYRSSSGDTYILLINGNQITLNKNNTGAQILISGLTANNGGNKFLSYFRSDGTTAWTTADGFSNSNNNANYLASIKVWITLDILNATKDLDFQTSINPRSNDLPNAPSLN